MTMTDPIADMLTRLRNANQAYHDDVTMPYSKLKAGVAEILRSEGYITSYDEADAPDGSLRSRRRGLPVHAKPPGRPKVLGGVGVALISTSQGLLTDRQANQKGV